MIDSNTRLLSVCCILIDFAVSVQSPTNITSSVPTCVRPSVLTSVDLEHEVRTLKMTDCGYYYHYKRLHQIRFSTPDCSISS